MLFGEGGGIGGVAGFGPGAGIADAAWVVVVLVAGATFGGWLAVVLVAGATFAGWLVVVLVAGVGFGAGLVAEPVAGAGHGTGAMFGQGTAGDMKRWKSPFNTRFSSSPEVNPVAEYLPPTL